MITKQEQYDIFDSEKLPEYKKGSTIKPNLKEALGRSFKFYHGMVKEYRYKKLMRGTHEERCAFLIEQNPESYERYYPMVRVMLEDRELNQMAMALVLNDELYLSCPQPVYRWFKGQTSKKAMDNFLRR